MNTQLVSQQTQKNWWIVAALFGSASLAFLSGIYFLFLPSGGFQGGRNPLYDLQVIFTRHTWNDLHTWSGIAMIVAAAIHLAIHWRWVVQMTRRTWNELSGRCGCMNGRGRWNLILNILVAISFFLTALSGVYFLFTPGGQDQITASFLFSRAGWDLLHTWAGVILIAAAAIHIGIHWKWVTKVTRKMIKLALPSPSTPQPISIHHS